MLLKNIWSYLQRNLIINGTLTNRHQKRDVGSNRRRYNNMVVSYVSILDKGNHKKMMMLPLSLVHTAWWTDIKWNHMKLVIDGGRGFSASRRNWFKFDFLEISIHTWILMEDVCMTTHCRRPMSFVRTWGGWQRFLKVCFDYVQSGALSTPFVRAAEWCVPLDWLMTLEILFGPDARFTVWLREIKHEFWWKMCLWQQTVAVQWNSYPLWVGYQECPKLCFEYFLEWYIIHTLCACNRKIIAFALIDDCWNFVGSWC